MGKASKQVTLKGWEVTRTEHAVKWNDKATGYGIWFPLSVVKVEKKTLTVPESMYIQKLEQYEREERADEIEGKKQDLKDLQQLERDIAKIEDKVYRPAPKQYGFRHILLFGMLAAAVYLAYKIFVH